MAFSYVYLCIATRTTHVLHMYYIQHYYVCVYVHTCTIYSVFLCVCTHMYYIQHFLVRMCTHTLTTYVCGGQRATSGVPSPPCGYWELNLGLRTWQQALLLSESSCSLRLLFSFFFFKYLFIYLLCIQ